MAADLRGAWEDFRGEYQYRTGRLLGELSSAWEDVSALTRTLQEAYVPHTWMQLEPGKVESLQVLFDEQAARLLHEPLAVFLKKRPLQRVLSAIEDYESGLGDLARQLPLQIEVPLAELLAAVAPDHVADWRKKWSEWRKSPMVVPLRDIVSSSFHRQSLNRSAADGEFQLALAQSALHLLGPWQACRRIGLSALSDRVQVRGEQEAEQRWWVQAAARHEGRSTRLIERYRDWAASSANQLVTAVVRRTRTLSDRRNGSLLERRQRFMAHWLRQQRAVQAVIDLERQMARLESDSTAVSAASLESVQSERTELIEELDGVVAWLESWQGGERNRSFPPPTARLMSAEERANDWARRIARAAGSCLPVAVEVGAPRRPLPSWRSPFRQLEPEKSLLRALEESGRPAVVEGLREAEAAHRAVVREIERAREVVAFGFESNESMSEESATFAREAVNNALSLLLYHQRTLIDPRPVVERSLTQGQAVVFRETHIALEEGRLGALAYLTRERGVRRAHQFFELALGVIRTGSRKAARYSRRGTDWLLQKAGWLTPPAKRLDPVRERAFLGQILEVRLGARELPMLYRRLFRLAPVEDPRFLVGRDAEMQGLSEALARWESGRSTAIIVVGARGSGKTSLLNCAASGVFSDIPAISGQFCHRVSRSADLDGFLRGLFQFAAETDVQTALAEGRRVVILEELERTFLRVIGGFEVLQAFLHLVEATSNATLWVLSINEIAFRYLDAVMGLGRAFSHRINAMSVRPEHVISAILQRHNLSGLRLEFAPLPEGHPRLSEFRQFVGLEQDPQELFFEALCRQSEGVFRSSFELWQDCIDRVEGGVVHMRQPLDPDYQPLLRELNLDDLFGLQAILQHGGLAHEELAQVLAIGVDESRRRMERLLALDILEPEPLCPGFRVRPQGGRFVRDALHRHNLW